MFLIFAHLIASLLVDHRKGSGHGLSLRLVGAGAPAPGYLYRSVRD